MGVVKLVYSMVSKKGKTVKRGHGAYILGHHATSIDGDDVNLERYKGQVLLIVNVASKCGMTPQYTQLVELQKKYKDQGFAVLGFPANDFGKQEPGSSDEIKTFCAMKYGVDFDLFSKITVKDPGQAPLYADLTSETVNGGLGGEIVWNFTKFLVGRDGHVVARAEPPLRPDDAQFVTAIEEALAKPA